MKKTITTCLLFLMTLNNSFAGEKETIIDRINNSDSIPVFIIHGVVKSDPYNAEMGRLALNNQELKMPLVASTFPVGIDSLHSTFAADFNEQFNTTKFYIAGTGSETEIHNLIKQGEIATSVILEFQANYSYLYENVRREGENLVTTRMLEALCLINFHEFNTEKNRVTKISGTIANQLFRFPLYRYVPDVTILMKEISPLSLKDSLAKGIHIKISEFAEKQKLKDEKEESKK